MRTMMFITIVTLLTMKVAKSEETKYPMCMDKTSWIEKNWCETVEFQKQGWEEGKMDLAKTKQDLKTLPDRFSKGVKEAPEKTKTFFVNTGNGISNWAKNEWTSIKEYQSKTWSK